MCLGFGALLFSFVFIICPFAYSTYLHAYILLVDFPLTYLLHVQNLQAEDDGVDRQLRLSLERAIPKRKLDDNSIYISSSESEPESKSEPESESQRQSQSAAGGDIPSDYTATTATKMDDTNADPPSKRVRSNDWPLSHPPRHNAEVAAESASHRSLRSRRGQTVSHSPKSPASRKLSRFVEGSMGDRVSSRPPKIYIDEDARIQPPASQSAAADTQQPVESPSSSEPHRFGKVLAWAFNPFNLWRQSRDSTSRTSMRDSSTDSFDSTRTDKAYRELKVSGYRGTGGLKTVSSNREMKSRDLAFSPLKTATTKELPPIPHLQPRQVNSIGRAPKKSASCMHIPSFSGRNLSDVENQNPLQEKPSRKELDREQRLMKKVSNLEERLEKARRQLDATRNANVHSREPSPQSVSKKPMESTRGSRNRFVPGALPSLPSERLLLGQAMSYGHASEASATRQYPARPTAITPSTSSLKAILATDERNSRKKPTARIVQDTDMFDLPADEGEGAKTSHAKVTPLTNRKRKTPSPEHARVTQSPSILSSGSEYKDDGSSAIDPERDTPSAATDPASTSTSIPRRERLSRKAKGRASYKIDSPLALASSDNELSACPSKSARTGASRRPSDIVPTRRSNRLMQDRSTRTITVTPGKDGNDTIPPVPPLPASYQGHGNKPGFEWPEECF